jgi:sulfate adenylyltransferase subunit 1
MAALAPAPFSPSPFSIDEFLSAEREKDLLRFSTAGSVDDGKSTLIGRLLYDTRSVYEDQVRSIEGKGAATAGQIDFALLTDGLRAEREQGITIDVAYRYFSTARRKFIIADTPGHEQYTRNMATGASNADAAIVLIDAGKGVQIQSRRHAYIASLLGVRHVLVAVNKMDLIGYSEAAFRFIENEFRQALDRIANATGTEVHAHFVPVSALKGDNVARSGRSAMPWYTGPSLLQLLETLPGARQTGNAPFRFPVQRVLRPNHSFRGFAGQIAAGVIRRGDSIVVAPSGNSAHVDRIVTFDGDLEVAAAPLSVTLVLDRELDISRGDLIAAADAPAPVARQLSAALVWMNERPLVAARRYLLKHASHTVPAFIGSVDHRVDLESLSFRPTETLRMNDIGAVTITLLRPIAVDLYRDNRTTGSLILIDPETNATVAAGMILSIAAPPGEKEDADAGSRVTPAERQARWGHRGGVLELSGSEQLVDSIERSLFSLGAVTVRVDAASEDFLRHPQLLSLVAQQHAQAGLLALVFTRGADESLTVRVQNTALELDAQNPARAIEAVHQLLLAAGIFTSFERNLP